MAKAVNKVVIIIFLPIVVTLLLLSIIKKVIYLSDEPKDKDCHLLYPYNARAPIQFIKHVAGHNQLPFFQKGGVIDDISCLNETSVYGVVQPRSDEDIKKALL